MIITVRDATYVLDAILDNETELAIREHTTDTAGATEIIFALFDLLGLRFTPRLRDIGTRRLYRSGALDLSRYPHLQPHLTGRINRQQIVEWWDAMLRLTRRTPPWPRSLIGSRPGGAGSARSWR